MHILVIGYVWPEPQSSAAGSRTEGLLRAFREAGWRVSFSSPSKENEHFHRTRAQVERAEIIEANDPRFDEFVTAAAPDVVVFDRFVIEEQFGWRVARAAPEALRVIDTQDLHFLRRARAKALAGGASIGDIAACRIELMTDDAVREISAIYRSDLTLLISGFERRLLMERFSVPGSLLQLLPFSFDPIDPIRPDGQAAAPPFAGRRHFAMIGNFRHPPNADGVIWMREEIWPRLRARLPDAEVHIYGAYPPKDVMAMDDPGSGFRVKGWIADPLETLSRYRVNLAPLRFGAGIKGKIAEGWKAGTPVVTTSIGAEGMFAGETFMGGGVGDDVFQFVDHAVLLHENQVAWSRVSAEGVRAFNSLFDRARHDATLLGSVSKSLEERDVRRRLNFTGRMLRHHLHRSTEYFSRWIELKARLAALKSGGSGDS